MSAYERISSEELAQEALLAERRRIENAVYRSDVRLVESLDALDRDSIGSLESLIELASEKIGQLQRLQSHINAHGVEIFEDLYESRRLSIARGEVAP